jgi:ribosomal protein S18 acetylase RimI-like enzyme
MAIDKDLMNTQTGGEGETVQIQTQEQVTPEQFDVEITPQESIADSEQVTTTETVTEQPIQEPTELPVQGEITEQEVVGDEPSDFYQSQDSFNKPPVDESTYSSELFNPLNVVDLVEDENGNLIQKTFEPDFQIPEPPNEIVENPFFVSPKINKNEFEETNNKINEDFKNSEIGIISEVADDDEKKKKKGFFKRMFSKEDKIKVSTYDGISSSEYVGDEISDEELLKLGEKIDKNPSVDPSKNLTEQNIVPEKKEEDLTGIVDKESVLGQLNSLIDEKKKIQDELKTAQGDVLKQLRKNLATVKGNIKQLKESENIKEEVSKPGFLPADFYSKKQAAPLSNIMPEESRAKNNYVVKKPLGMDVSDSIFAKRIASGDMSSMEANNILYRLFVSPSKKAYWGDSATATKMAIYGLNDEGEKIHKALTYEEALSIDRTFRSMANWAKDNGGKSGSKYKATLFPAFGNLPETTVEVLDKNGNIKTVTLFSDIYDSQDNRMSVKNGYGVSAAFQGEKSIDISDSKRDYFVPNSIIKEWEKNIKGFSPKVFKQQQRLARLTDKEGKPYLQSDRGLFGVGITGIADKETSDAQKRLESDVRVERGRKGAVVKGDIEFGRESDKPEDWTKDQFIQFKSVEDWKKSNLKYGRYNVKDIPVELMRNTGDALAWATNHLPTAKEVNFSNPNIFEQGQDSFKSYIDGLGLKGIKVEPLGAWYNANLDYVRLDSPSGSLTIDLNEGDDDLNNQQLKRLNDWIKVAQDDPRSEFIQHFNNSFNKDLAVSRTILKEEALGNNFTLKFGSQTGNNITVTNEEGKLAAQEYLNEIEFTNEYYKKIKEDAESFSQEYNSALKPSVDKFKKAQEDSERAISLLEKEFETLQSKFDQNQIKDDEFKIQTNDINNKISLIQENLSKSYSQLQTEVGNNKGVLDVIKKQSDDLAVANANLIAISDDIKDLAAIETTRIMADNTGPGTVVGHIAGAFVNGMYKPYLATVSAASDALITAGVYPEGMTKEEAFKMNNEWKEEFLYGELSDALEKSIGMDMSEGYESRLSVPGQAVYGVFESVGTQFNPLVAMLKGTPLAGVASTLGFASQSYTQIEEEILKNPELKDIPEYQKKLMTIPYAMGMSLIDKWGYGKLTGGKSSITQRLMVSVVNQALKKAPKNATLETIEALIKGDIKSNAAKFVLAVNRAGLVEAETEAIQAATLDVGLKELADNMLGLDAFNQGNTFDDYVKLVFKNAAMGYIGGGVLGGTIKTAKFFKDGRVDLINPEDYDFFRLVNGDTDLKKTLTADVANQFVKGDISKQEAEELMVAVENLNQLDKKIHKDITGDDRLKMVALMSRKQKIQEEIEGLDESQRNLTNPALESINSQMEEIVKRTDERIKKQQEYDQKDEERLSSEVGEGQEPIETQPIEGASDQEVTTGGVVQEEQREVKLNENLPKVEIEAEVVEEKPIEGEITPTEPQKITSVMTTGETQLESDLIGKDVSTGKQTTTSDIQTGETVSKFQESRNPTKGKVVNVEADPRNKNIERLILEDGTVLNRNKNTGNITLNNKVKASTVETEVKSDYQISQEATNEVSKENPDASVLLTPKGEDLSLTAVYVAKENRGKGIGTKVLESVKKQADKLGKKVVLDATTELDEETDLGRLESFYDKNGFTKVGDNKFEYTPTTETTETVTPETKTEEVVTPTETVTKTEEVVTPTTEAKVEEQAAPETKQPTKEAVAAKNMADILRKAKIKMEGGTAMASFLPGFENVWNGSIETVSKAIELGGITAGNFRQSIDAGMKALKQTDAYKAITDPKERAKISARYKKILTSAYSEGYNIDTDNLREAEFNDFNQKLEESKGKTLSNKEFNALKAEAKKFVNDNLPTDSYKKSEVQSYVRNNFDKAKTVEDIQKNLDKVNSIMTTKEAKIETAEAKQADKDRKAAAKRIKTKVNPRGKFMSVKSGDTRKSKVSIDAQEKIDSMREQGMFEDDYLNSLNKEDTDALESQVDEILGIGKEERKAQVKEKRTEKKTDEATILQSLSKPDEIVNSESGINTLFANNRGAVVVIKDKDGNEVSMNKEDFANYMNENPKADLTGSKFYKSKLKDMGRMKEKYATGILGKLRRLGMGPLRNLETYASDLSKGSRKMRDWMSKKVDEISFASLQKLEEAYYLKRDVIKGLDKVFGTAGGFSNSDLILNQKSGIQSDAGTENATDLTNGEILDIYNLVRSEYDGKEIDPKKVERNRERVRVANQIDPDEVIRYVESNPQLKEACDFVADKFNKDYRPLFAPTFEAVSGFKMPDGYYYPEPASDVSAADVMNLEDSPKAMSAMVPNLRLRKNYNGAFQVTDIREKLDNYINSMTHAKAFIPIVDSMRPLFSDINRPRVLEKLGNTDKYNDLKQTLERIFTGKSAYEDQTGFGKDFGMIANFATVGALIFRPKAIAQQASAFVNYYPAGKLEGVDAINVAASVVPITKEQRKFWLDFYGKNPYLYERLSGSNTSIDAQALQSDIDKIANDYLRGAIDMATFLGMLSIKTGDALSVATPYGGEGFAMAHFKKRFKENGGDYEDARNYGIQQWFKQTERTQQPSKDPTAISTASQNPIVRMTMPFLSAQYSATRKAVIALKNMKDWKNLNKAEKQQARTDFLYYSTFGNIPFLIGSGTIFGIINVAESMMSADDDEEKRIADNKLKILLSNTFLDRVQSDLQAFYLLGKIGGEALNQLRGRDFDQNNPTFQRITKIATAIQGYTKGVFNDKWSDLTAEEKANFFNRYRMSDYDIRKFEKMNEEDKQQYLDDHPFIRQQIAAHRLEEWNDKYSSLRADQRMGKEEWDAMMEAFNIKNAKKLAEGIDAWLEGNASFLEAVYNTTMGDDYFKWDIKNDANFLLKLFFGETPASMLTPVETVIPEEKDFNKFMKGGEGQVGGQTGGQTGGQVGGQQ